MNTARISRVFFVLLAAGSLAFVPAHAGEADRPVILIFYEQGCESCIIVEELIGELALDLPESAIRRYEISQDETLELLLALESAYDVDVATVPTVFVGDEVVVGSGESEEIQLRAAIGDCVVRGCPSPLERIWPYSFPWDDLLWLGVFVALLFFLVVTQLP